MAQTPEAPQDPTKEGKILGIPTDAIREGAEIVGIAALVLGAAYETLKSTRRGKKIADGIESSLLGRKVKAVRDFLDQVRGDHPLSGTAAHDNNRRMAGLIQPKGADQNTPAA